MTAHIESITPVGQVYASQQFAALASTQKIIDFNCDYVGRVPLPKKAGIVPLPGPPPKSKGGKQDHQ